MQKRLTIELLLIFVALPLVLAVLKPRSWIYLLLMLFAFKAWLFMKKAWRYDFYADWNRDVMLEGKAFKPIFIRYIPCVLLLLAFTAMTIPERMFSLILDRPYVWAMVMTLYPLLSVFPQEIIFRSFFLNRYAPLFKTERALMTANALAFGFAHIVLHSPVAMIFCTIGGWLFAHTYLRTKSLCAVWIEHALYGCTVFTLGLGFYFYHGYTVH
jgi:membrane protease YdiL (CAAX protease family)